MARGPGRPLTADQVFPRVTLPIERPVMMPPVIWARAVTGLTIRPAARA